MAYPTFEEIEALHRKYAPNEEAFNSVFQHCVIVRDIALWCVDANGLTEVDLELIKAGCLLHDIGVYELYSQNVFDGKNYIRHGLMGYEILKGEGFSEELCRMVLCHVGVGLTKADIKKDNLPLPDGDYIPKTLEERLLMYADKFHSKHPSRFYTAGAYKSRAAKFGADKVLIFEELVKQFKEPPVERMAETFNQPLIKEL